MRLRQGLGLLCVLFSACSEVALDDTSDTTSGEKKATEDADVKSRESDSQDDKSVPSEEATNPSNVTGVLLAHRITCEFLDKERTEAICRLQADDGSFVKASEVKLWKWRASDPESFQYQQKSDVEGAFAMGIRPINGGYLPDSFFDYPMNVEVVLASGEKGALRDVPKPEILPEVTREEKTPPPPAPGEFSVTNDEKIDIPDASYSSSVQDCSPSTYTRVATSSVEVTGADNPLTNIVVTLHKLGHTAAGDLSIFLGSPEGSCVQLVERRRELGNHYMETVFTDAATNGTVGSFNPPYSGEFKPEEPLAAFNGEVANGTWTLYIYDTYLYDSGDLESWTLSGSTEP